MKDLEISEILGKQDRFVHIVEGTGMMRWVSNWKMKYFSRLSLFILWRSLFNTEHKMPFIPMKADIMMSLHLFTMFHWNLLWITRPPLRKETIEDCECSIAWHAYVSCFRADWSSDDMVVPVIGKLAGLSRKQATRWDKNAMREHRLVSQKLNLLLFIKQWNKNIWFTP